MYFALIGLSHPPPHTHSHSHTTPTHTPTHTHTPSPHTHTHSHSHSHTTHTRSHTHSHTHTPSLTHPHLNSSLVWFSFLSSSSLARLMSRYCSVCRRADSSCSPRLLHWSVESDRFRSRSRIFCRNSLPASCSNLSSCQIKPGRERNQSRN